MTDREHHTQPWTDIQISSAEDDAFNELQDRRDRLVAYAPEDGAPASYPAGALSSQQTAGGRVVVDIAPGSWEHRLAAAVARLEADGYEALTDTEKAIVAYAHTATLNVVAPREDKHGS